MTRKRTLGRLLVVALVVAAMVAPASLASAEVTPVLSCNGVLYTGAEDQVVFPNIDVQVAEFIDPWPLFHARYDFWTVPPAIPTNKVQFLNLNLAGLDHGVTVFVDEAALTLLRATLVGGADMYVRINGTAYDDVICGSTGIDIIRSRAGNDIILGDAGDDILFGGEGDDAIFGGAGNDGIVAGGGTDAIYGGAVWAAGTTPGPWPFAGAKLTARVQTGNTFTYNVLIGGGGNDTIYSEAGKVDDLYGKGGNDTLYGDMPLVYFFGGPGDDTIYAPATGSSRVRGMAGNDTIYGGAAADPDLRGGVGDDHIYGMGGVDILRGNAGNDVLYQSSPTTLTDTAGGVLYGGPGNDELWGAAGVDSAYGGAGDDTLVGDKGGDFLFGEAGNDIIRGGIDTSIVVVDTLVGGAGADTLYAEGTNANVHGAFGTGLPTDFDGAIDMMYGSPILGSNNHFWGGCAVGELDQAVGQIGTINTLHFVAIYSGPTPIATFACP